MCDGCVQSFNKVKRALRQSIIKRQWFPPKQFILWKKEGKDLIWACNIYSVRTLKRVERSITDTEEGARPSKATDEHPPAGGCASLGDHARRCRWTSLWRVPPGPQRRRSPGWWPATERRSSEIGWRSQLTSPCEAAGRSSAGSGRTSWSRPNCSEWESGKGCSWRTHCLWRWLQTPPALRGEEKHLR